MPKILQVAILLIALVAVPAPAAATHWSTESVPFASTAGVTREDDAAVVSLPGNPFDGVANRVTPAGATRGDGSLFLDARLANAARVQGTATPHVRVGPLLAIAGDHDILLPGELGASAWFGEWRDLNTDGIIADVDDSACGESACATDEFTWRGLRSGHPTTMVYFEAPDQFIGARANATEFDTQFFDDHTLEVGDQGWYGPVSITADGPLLSSFYTIVVAGTRPAVGSAIGFELDTPGSLLDVDFYESVNPDVESLYEANANLLLDAGNSVTTAARAGVAEKRAEILALAAPLTAEANALVAAAEAATSDPQATASATAARANPRHAKEPNHPDDDFGARAQFGGVGDGLGSFNTYDGYRDRFHLYADVLPHHAAFKTLTDLATRVQPDPLGGLKDDNRSAGQYLYFEANLFLWKDVNKDTHIGAVCDPDDPEKFDAERNTCRSPPSPWPHSIGQSNTAEIIQMCETAQGRGTTFKLVPVGGPWPSVVVSRDYDPRTGVTAVELHADSEPITMRWREACTFGRYLASRDSIYFPTVGSTIGVRIETEFAIAGYSDTNAGIEVGPETVRDIDFLIATL